MKLDFRVIIMQLKIVSYKRLFSVAWYYFVTIRLKINVSSITSGEVISFITSNLFSISHFYNMKYNKISLIPDTKNGTYHLLSILHCNNISLSIVRSQKNHNTYQMILICFMRCKYLNNNSKPHLILMIKISYFSMISRWILINMQNKSKYTTIITYMYIWIFLK